MICVSRVRELVVSVRGLARIPLLILGVLFFFLPAAHAASATSQFESEWAKLIAAAQQEGRLVISAGGAPSREYRSVVELFQKKFGLQVSLSTGSGAASIDRVLAERNAGKYTVDVGLTSVAATRTRLVPAQALEPIPPLLIHPEVLDKSAWFAGRHWYADPQEEKLSFLYAAEPTETFSVWYNTKVISKQEIATIKSPADLLDPKWRGKVTSRTWGDRGRVGEMQNIYFQPDMGIEWIRAFFGQAEARFSDDVRIRESWVIGGSVPIAFSDGDLDRELERLEKAGMPVALHSIPYKLPFLTAGGSGCCIQVYNRAPHPNAAKLYLNWFLSKEGQTAIHQVTPSIARQSMREDIPFGNIEAKERRVPGRQYIFRDADPKYVAQDKEQRDVIVEAWKNRRR
ncbi:MAG TPA: ABC transporter substrate-binding protein [Candidatus Binatia bacterium]